MMQTPTSARITRKHRPDFVLIIALGLLIVLGLVVIYSISPVLSQKLLGDPNRNYFFYGQLTHLAIGLSALIIVSFLHWQNWKKLLPPLLIISGLSLVLLMIPGIGVTKNGATRWLDIGPLSFQPAELLKFSVLLLLASRFASLSPEQMRDNKQSLWPTLGILGILAVLVLFLQRDLGTMLVIAGIISGLFFTAGASAKQLATLGAISFGVGLGSILIFPHRVARLITFLHPESAGAANNYHLNQALIAIGSGGIFGLGIGKSVQIYGYLPESANDSIFAIIGETFGLFGCVVILGLFGLLLWRCLKVALGAPDRFSRLIVIGVTIWLGVQTAINIGAMLGLIPLTGIPLPFLSYGGTSLIATLVALGMVINISKYTLRGDDYANRFERRRDRRSHYADQSLGRRAARV